MESAVIQTFPLASMPWPTIDPFLFCVHHLDHYPKGNAHMGPAEALTGRQIGSDFSGKNGWSMYHGDQVPGFPGHPHRGFETITIARNGYIDHSDSLGATARFGHGDVQWMTAGKGVVHAEMFPLVHQDKTNPTELFQIWLNLPRAKKLVDPHFTMFWADTIPTKTVTDDHQKNTVFTVIAGHVEGMTPPASPPDSWAADPDNHVAVWTLKMQPGAKFELPVGSEDAVRTLYFFSGSSLSVDDTNVSGGTGIVVDPTRPVILVNGEKEAEILVLQGRPIQEPVAQHGPFVMNYQGEIRQAMIDYQQTRFGGWPWKTDGPVHPRERQRFAIHADGREEIPQP